MALAMLALMAFPSLGIALAAPLTVEMDSESYEPGEKVEISGISDANASVTILVVFNSTTIYTNVTEADEDGEFYTEFQLSEDASDGLYNVTASTDGVEAKTHFTVIPDEDDPSSGENGGEDDEGAASLSVETDSVFYEPGEYVEISGVADENASVAIVVVVNSTLETMYDNVTDADEDGDFSVRFQLPEDASEGLYNVTASTDEVEAETYFTVALDGDLDGETGDDGTDDGGSAEEDAERAIGLKVAIDRAIRFLDKVNATAIRLNETGYEVQDIEANLTEARNHLDEALILLEELDINGTAHELAKARGILGRTTGWLHSTAEKVKETKVKTFLQNVEGQINGLEAKINQLQDRLENGTIVLSALQAKRRQLIRIRERLAAGDVDGVIDNLDNMIEDIDEELNNLNGESTSVKLKAMNRIEAKIRVLNATAQRLSRKGEDTSEIEEELTDATTLLSQTMELLDSGDIEGAEELLEEAEEHLEKASDIIRGMTHPNKTEGHSNGSRGKKHGSES